MEITVVAFGIARDILSSGMTQVELSGDSSIGNLKNQLIEKYPDFGALASLRFAVNEEYQADSFQLKPGDEVVIIPPVSGG